MSLDKITDRLLRAILEEWGREYRKGGITEIGFSTKNYLYDLIQFQGRIPIAIGHKPESVNETADRVERHVTNLAKLNMRAAVCLRTYYCERGRVTDKYEMASEVLDDLSLSSFKSLVKMGEMYVAGAVAVDG